MERPMAPFFDTTDKERVQLALNVLNFPQHFCIKESNRPHLDRLLPQTAAVSRLVDALRAAQSTLAAYLPIAVDGAWRQRDKLSPSIVPTTSCNRAVLLESSKQEFARALDRGLLEAVIERMTEDCNGVVDDRGLALALACAWLSQHLALVVIGVAKVEFTSSNELLITPASQEKSSHLRRLWFAAVFEEVSLLSAHARVESYSLLAGGSPHLRGNIEEAFWGAVSVIPQHWRLPVNDGPVAQLLFTHLAPLVGIVGAAFQAAMFRGGRPVFEDDLPRNPDARKLFSELIRQQKELPSVDRLFDVQSGGLVLGPRKIAPGLLLIAEHIAAKNLGSEWHNKQLSEVQKRYLIERLSRLGHVDVLDVELRQHDTTDQVHVDVDLFVRDRQNGILFAVQLKHFEYSKKGGIRNWLERFRSGKLAYGIDQLVSIRELAMSDSRVRKRLLANGMTVKDIECLVPVVLHNIGVLDCLVFQAGVLVYDQHTFVNVLDGRAAVGVGAVNGEAIQLSLRGDATKCRLDDPDSVIAAYSADKSFGALVHFDAAADTTRRLDVSGITVVARGLGI